MTLIHIPLQLLYFTRNIQPENMLPFLFANLYLQRTSIQTSKGTYNGVSSRLFGKVQIVAEPLSSNNLFDRQTGITICQWEEEPPAGKDNSQNHTTGNPSSHHALARKSLAGSNVLLGSLSGSSWLVGWFRIENKLDEGAGDQARGKMSWQIVVQEKLTAHDVEWEVMGSPCNPEEPSRVVQP